MLFGLDYLLALIKIGANVAFAIVSAIPFYFAWNCIAPIYLINYIPLIFTKLPYWHIVAFFLCATFLGEQIKKLIPKLVSISNNSTSTNTES